MPVWISFLELGVKLLVWLYGHPAVSAKLEKYKPLTPDVDPSPVSERGPIEKHFGGI
jgi:hypothetical protein